MEKEKKSKKETIQLTESDKRTLQEFKREMKKQPEDRGEIWFQWIQDRMYDVDEVLGTKKKVGRPKKWDDLMKKTIYGTSHATPIPQYNVVISKMSNEDMELVKKIHEKRVGSLERSRENGWMDEVQKSKSVIKSIGSQQEHRMTHGKNWEGVYRYHRDIMQHLIGKLDSIPIDKTIDKHHELRFEVNDRINKLSKKVARLEKYSGEI